MIQWVHSIAPLPTKMPKERDSIYFSERKKARKFYEQYGIHDLRSSKDQRGRFMSTTPPHVNTPQLAYPPPFGSRERHAQWLNGQDHAQEVVRKTKNNTSRRSPVLSPSLTSDAYPKPGVIRRLEVRLQALEAVVPPRAALSFEPELPEVQGHLVDENQRCAYRELEEVNHLERDAFDAALTSKK